MIAYWADTDLCFVDLARRRCEEAGVGFRFIRIAHHRAWFTAERSWLSNALHLSRLFLQILLGGVGASVCVFGTNACRAMYPWSFLFKRTLFVYNELPAVSKRSLAYWYDRLVFRSERHVYVSSHARARFVEALFALTLPVGVLENIAVSPVPEPSSPHSRRGTAVFAGTVTRRRFNDRDLAKFRMLSRTLRDRIVVYGRHLTSVSDEFADVLEYRGSLPHGALLEELSRFKYGLLAYYRGEPNYELCAPLKIFEYVSRGCRVLSINRNAGLVAVAEQYPALIGFVDEADVAIMPSAPDEYDRQSRAFLAGAFETNERFVNLLVA
jgi:hypothetical protein